MIELSKRLLRQVGQTNARYNMIEGGDKILLGLSGGKDSLFSYEKRNYKNWNSYGFSLLKFQRLSYLSLHALFRAHCNAS